MSSSAINSYKEAAKLIYDRELDYDLRHSNGRNLGCDIGSMVVLAAVGLAGGGYLFTLSTAIPHGYVLIGLSALPLIFGICSVVSYKKANARIEADGKDNFSRLKGICERHKQGIEAQQAAYVTNLQSVKLFVDALPLGERKDNKT